MLKRASIAARAVLQGLPEDSQFQPGILSTSVWGFDDELEVG
jgi:hypothetical protein